MWVAVNEINGVATVTLAASHLKLKPLMIAKISEYPSKATTDK